MPKRVLTTVGHWFAESVFQRIFKNAGMMLGGRTTNGLLNLAMMSLLARGLGVEQFGVFILVQTYAQVIIALATFQSWQAVIRYGAICLEKDDTRGFQSLFKLATVLDIGGVIFAAAIAYFAAPLVGPYLGWSDEVIRYAQPYSLLILFNMTAAPTGILRLFDRFDLLASHTIVMPLFRLIGVAVAFFLVLPFWTYLAAGFIASAVGGAVLLYFGWREAYRRGRLAGLTFSFVGITRAHRGILRFSLLSNLFMAQQAIMGQMSTLLIGLLAGPAAAGIFRIGRDVATVLSKPAELLNQSIYPEFARFSSKRDWSEFGRLILRGASLAAAGGVGMTLLTIVIGGFFLELFFGAAFAGAYWPLVLLVAAAALTIIGFPMDPALFAMGRAGIPLRISTTAIFLVYLPLLVALVPIYGPSGAGIATIAAAAVTATTMSFFAIRQLRRQIATA